MICAGCRESIRQGSRILHSQNMSAYLEFESVYESNTLIDLTRTHDDVARLVTLSQAGNLALPVHHHNILNTFRFSYAYFVQCVLGAYAVCTFT